MSSENNDSPTLLILSNDFFAGYQKATRDFDSLQSRRKGATFDDVSVSKILIEMASYCDKTNFWKAGYCAGFFASIYRIPYTWVFWEEFSSLYCGIRRAS
jgi:hypothetical protein